MELFANSGDTDPMPHFAAYDLGLHCLPVTLLRVSDYNGFSAENAGKKFNRQHFEFLLKFLFRKKALIFHANCLLRSLIKCQSLFSGKK